MKVALLTNEFPPDIYGGAGIHVQFLSRELRAHCEIEARAFGQQNDFEKNLHALGFAPKLDSKPVDPRMSKILNPLDINLQWASSLKNIDIVHCHTWYSHFGGVVASKLFECPLVLTTHSLEPHRPWKAEQLGNGGYQMSTWIERSAYQTADGVIAVSKEMKRDVMELYGVPADRVQVIYNGIDPDFITAGQRKLSNSDGGHTSLSDGSLITIVMVGRLSGEKRQDVIINAVPFSKYADRIQLVFAGKGPKYDEYVELGKQLKNPPQFVFLSKPELIDLLLHTDLYVHASDMESEAISCIEAFATGLVPVIANSEDSATPQFALDGRSLFAPGRPKDLARAIDWWFDHPDEKAKMEREYAEAAKNYDIDTSVRLCEQMFREAIEETENQEENHA